MAKKRRSRKAKGANKKGGGSLREVLSLYAKISELRKEIGKATGIGTRAEERLTDLEIHVNLLARLLTTLCIEKLGMRVGALRSMVRRIEKEALRDSQIMELEFLYKLPHGSSKKTASSPVKSKDDPWEQIS